MDKIIDGYKVRITITNKYATMSVYDAFGNVKLTANVMSSLDVVKAYGTIGRRTKANKWALESMWTECVSSNNS